MMTTMAALLGALPLALGTGDGAELRRPLGIAIVGGLIVSQLLTLYTTPVVYLYLDRFRLWARRAAARRAPAPPRAATRDCTTMSACSTSALLPSPPPLAGCMPSGPTTCGPTAPTPAAYKEADGWKVAQPRRRPRRKGAWWEVVRRSRARTRS